MAKADTIRSQIDSFVMLPEWVLDRCRDSRAIHLYMLLRRRYNRRTRRAWPPREELMAGLGVSSRSLDRAIAVLRDCGAMTTELRHRPTDGAVIGVDYLLVQVDPHFATDGEKADPPIENLRESAPPAVHSATAGEKGDRSISPEKRLHSATGGVAIRRTRSTNQIQERTYPELETFRDAWNAAVTAPILACGTLTKIRRRCIRACLVQYPLAEWQAIFARVNASDFCRGVGRDGWVASFDWLIKGDAAVKVREGLYDTRGTPKGAAPLPMRAFECPHEPKCLGRHACHLKTALANAKAS